MKMMLNATKTTVHVMRKLNIEQITYNTVTGTATVLYEGSEFQDSAPEALVALIDVILPALQNDYESIRNTDQVKIGSPCDEFFIISRNHEL